LIIKTFEDGMKYKTITTRQYKKSYKKMRNNKKLVKDVEHVISILESGESLPRRYRDHRLSGDMRQYRELHVRPDVLLVYEKHEEVLIIFLITISSHSDIF